MAPEGLALAAAFCFALSSLILGALKGRVPLMQLARWQQVAAFGFTALVGLLVGGWQGIEPWQYGLLAASGFVGITIASTTYFGALYTIGPRLTALLFSLTSPFSLGLGFVFLGETVSAGQGAGVALVVGGIGLAISPGGRDAVGPHWRLGILLGVITALGQAAGSLLARPAMAAGVEPFTAMAIRTGLTVVLLISLTALPRFRTGEVPARGRPFALAMLAALVGTALGMTLLMAALEQGDVGIVSTLSSITPVLILPLVWAATGERPRPVAWLGAALAVAGVALISL